MRQPILRLLSVRRSLPLFLAIVVCLAIWQVWLTWRLMEQEGNLAAQRSRERLEQIADLGMVQLAGKLGEWDLGLRESDAALPSAALKASPPRDATLVVLGAHSVAAYPAVPLLFVPDPPAAAPLPDVFETAEKLEFRDQNFAGAVDALRPLTEQPATRAEALLRIARLERKLNHPEAASAAYDRLSQESAVSPDGVPYALLAMGARGGAERLRTALTEGRWPIRRETFEYYWARTQKNPPADSLAFSSLVERLDDQWRKAPGSGREIQPDGSLLIWHTTPSRLTAMIAPVGWLAATLKLPANASDIRWRFASEQAAAGQYVRRSLAEAQLAGRIEFYSVAPVSNGEINRTLWLAGVALMLALVLAGAYAMHRGVSQELRAAQLQSDFVSAVSHEFRSP